MRITKILGLALAIALFGSLSSYGQFHLGKDKDKDKDKETVMKEKEERRDAKNLRNYEKVKTYALNKYDVDPDFRDDVDEGFSDLLRQHKEIAYEHNMNRKSRVFDHCL